MATVNRWLFCHFLVHAGSFHVSVIHQTLTKWHWLCTGSLTCVCDNSYTCITVLHTGVRHTDGKSAQHFWLWKTDKFFLCFWLGSNFGSSNPDLNQLKRVEPPHHRRNFVIFSTTFKMMYHAQTLLMILYCIVMLCRWKILWSCTTVSPTTALINVCPTSTMHSLQRMR